MSQLVHVSDLLAERKMILNVSPDARDKLAEDGFDPHFGEPLSHPVVLFYVNDVITLDVHTAMLASRWCCSCVPATQQTYSKS